MYLKDPPPPFPAKPGVAEVAQTSLRAASLNTCRKDCRLFAVSTSQIDEMFDVREQSAAVTSLPAQLKEFADVVSPEKAEKQPLHRP